MVASTPFRRRLSLFGNPTGRDKGVVASTPFRENLPDLATQPRKWQAHLSEIESLVVKGRTGACDPLFCAAPDAHTVDINLKRAQIPLYYANLPTSVVLGFLRTISVKNTLLARC